MNDIAESSLLYRYKLLIIISINNYDTKNRFLENLNISFFDKDNEVILNIPKKNITDKERIKLLPEFLKEIQIKMNHLEEDNKKLKNEYKNMGVGENSLNGVGGADDEFFGEKERKNKGGKGIKKKIIKK